MTKDFQRNSANDLDQAWARQLHHEFAQICWQYSLDLAPPVIELIQSDHRLGYWQPSSRTIGINRQVILQYGWDATIHVLKHEMAHQICDEVFGCCETAHAGTFHRACNMLGLPEKFSRAGIDPQCFTLVADGDTGRDGSRVKVIEKVRKVLALSHSTNEHEARSALETAVRLMHRYELEQADIELQQADITYVIISLARRRICFYQRLIASLLSRYFRVRFVCSSMYDASVNQAYRTFEVFGRRENVEVAEHCYYFLESRLAALWLEHCRNWPVISTREKSSYYCGVLQGFEQTLKKNNRGGPSGQEKPPDCRPGRTSSLPVPADALVEVCIERRHPRLRRGSRRKTPVNQEIFSQGIVAGREIRLRDAVGNGGPGGLAVKLIENRLTR